MGIPRSVLLKYKMILFAAFVRNFESNLTIRNDKLIIKNNFTAKTHDFYTVTHMKIICLFHLRSLVLTCYTSCRQIDVAEFSSVASVELNERGLKAKLYWKFSELICEI